MKKYVLGVALMLSTVSILANDALINDVENNTSLDYGCTQTTTTTTTTSPDGTTSTSTTVTVTCDTPAELVAFINAKKK